MHDAAPTADDDRAPTRSGWRHRGAARIAAAAVGAALLVLAAWLITGPAPEPADAGFPKQPPPLALPSDTPEQSPLALAAAKLANGDLDEARREFTDVVAEDQDGIAGQVGLVLSRWRATGPVSVERDLRQLVREYPDSAFAALHLGLVQALLDDPRSSRQTLREAMRLGHDAGDETSLRMARLANDLLHPDAFAGDLSVLVAPAEVPAAERAQLRRLLDAVRAGDANEVRELVRDLDDAAGMMRVAVVAASFDKDEPDVAADRLAEIAASPGEAAAVRDRARLMSTLARLWGGGERDAACTALAASARGGVDAATRRLASPIESELCAGA